VTRVPELSVPRRGAMGDAPGLVSALTVWTPIVPGRFEELERYLESLPNGDGSPAARIETTHLFRWLLVPQLVHQGAPMKPDGLRSQYLVFTAAFDGSEGDYIEAMRTRLPDECDAVCVRRVPAPQQASQPALRQHVSGRFRGGDPRRARTEGAAVLVRGRGAGDGRRRASSNLLRDVRLTSTERHHHHLHLPHRPHVRLPKRRHTTPEIEVDDIQGNVLRGYTYAAAMYVFVHIADAEQGRRWVARLVDEVTPATPWGADRPDCTLNCAFTYAGLVALGVPDSVLKSFPVEFREGMAARAGELGDTGPSAPEHWEPGLGTGQAHVLLTLHAEHDDLLRERLARVYTDVDRSSGLEIVHEQHAGHLPGQADHFGFRDGIAQPVVEGGGVEPRPGDGVFDKRGRWRAMKTGEFVFGYVDEDGVLPDPPAAPLDRNGTFMVYRKLQMDVALFRRYLKDAARAYPHGDEELLAAKIVGRWRDGTPLSVSPERPDAAIASDPARVNDFRYGSDPDGLACPLGAHIRRSNPRDALGFEGRTVFRHRIIRRGRAYGPPLAEGALEDDGVDRGLVFTCFQTSIARQFELIQRIWVNDGDAFGLAGDKDFLIGNGLGQNKMTIQGKPPYFLARHPGFVTTRGGEYLFRPGIRALQALADGVPG
jgi:Dyp-type peroxidase family